MSINNHTIASNLVFSLVRDSLPQGFNSTNTNLPHHLAKSVCVLWLHTGHLTVNDESLSAGNGIAMTASDAITNHSNEPSVMLRFIISTGPLTAVSTSDSVRTACETLFTQRFNATSADCLLRLDQVDFPPGAIAYKHTHPGPGIRYLVKGGLTLSGNHHDQHVNSGDAWFEDANSPVQATAINSMPSQFVRAMLLPLEYEQRSTFTLHNEADASKPRLQTNIRHVEQRINLTDIG